MRDKHKFTILESITFELSWRIWQNIHELRSELEAIQKWTDARIFTVSLWFWRTKEWAVRHREDRIYKR